MRQAFKPNAYKFFLSVVTATLLATPINADCTYELFNIASVKGTSVGEFIDQISDECGMSLIVTDAEAETILKKQMNKTYLKNLTINEVLDLIVKENGLQYTLQNNVLKISYLKTKTYQLDYIIGERKGTGSTNIRLSSNTGSSAGSSGSSSSSGSSGSGSSSAGGASSESGTNITSTDEVQFWKDLDKELVSILNRPEDTYKVQTPMINKNAGLVTVTATGDQIKRLDAYINDLQTKMQSQVMIDVKMYSVVFSDGSTMGVDWSQIYKLQNVDLAFDNINTKDVSKFTSTPLMNGTAFSEFMTYDGRRAASSVFQLSAKASISELIKFLKSQGDVYAISNPKILTLNNQPALITAGTELFYKTTNTSTLAGGTTGEQATSEIISSVFSGVLLDITPEISNDGSITLRINPSISDTVSDVSSDNSNRKMPPDLNRRQISSVIKVQDGSRIILGGLINTKTTNDTSKLPLLGDIPYLGYLFKHESTGQRTEELVIIIEPHIIKRDGSNIGLSDLGYSRIAPAMEKNRLTESEKAKSDSEDVKEMKEDLK